MVTGTDTGIGKTVFSAGLANLLGANYWKPVQAGLEGGDRQPARSTPGQSPADRIVPELYRLRTPGSPHYSAEIDGVRIDADSLRVPAPGERPLVIGHRRADDAAELRQALHRHLRAMATSLVLCASTVLGTINHSLLSIEALRKRQIPILGIAFIGGRNAETESAICEIGRVRWLGRLPWISPLTTDALHRVFKGTFMFDDFVR